MQRSDAEDSWDKILEACNGDAAQEVDLSEPAKLYLTDDQARSFEIATVYNRQYESHINNPIGRLLIKHKSEVLDSLCASAGNVDFIDLGPGHPVKSLVLIEQLRRQNKQVAYFPVDVSNYFLRKSVTSVRAKGIHATPIHCSFEELAPIIGKYCHSSNERIFFLGLTFCNFEVKQISRLLSHLIRYNDICLICSQSAYLGSADLLIPYMADDVRAFSFGHLRHLGLRDDDFSYEPRLVDACIQTTFVTKKEITSRVLIPKSMRFITARSYRNSVEEIEKEVNSVLRHVKTYSDTTSDLSLIQITGRANSFGVQPGEAEL